MRVRASKPLRISVTEIVLAPGTLGPEETEELSATASVGRGNRLEHAERDHRRLRAKLATVKIVLPGCVCVQKTYRAAVGGALTARELWLRRIWFLPLFVFMLLYGDARPWPYTLWCF